MFLNQILEERIGIQKLLLDDRLAQDLGPWKEKAQNLKECVQSEA